jgi:HEAT repeat protein
MDHPVTFARHFAQLVRLVDANVDVVAQKAALRSCLAASKQGTIALSARGSELVAGGQAVSADPSVTALAQRIDAHRLEAVVVDAGASPGDVLAAARWLAAPSGGAALGDLKTVHVEPMGDPAAAPSTGATAGARRPSRSVRRKSGVQPAVDVPPAPPSRKGGARADAVPAGPRRKSGNMASIDPSPRKSGKMQAVRNVRTPAITGPQRRSGMITAIDFEVVVDTPWGRKIAALNNASADAERRIVDELTGLAEAGVREGSGDAAADVAAALLMRAGEARTSEMARVYEAAMQRLTTPATLALIVRAGRAKDRSDVVLYVLRQAGPEGASAVIRQVMQAPTLADRRQSFELLIKLPAAVGVLTRMLGDGRWYVARNAADLLGELHANEAEEALGAALAHTDERVRRAAANALSRLGTQRAVQSLQGALTDPSPRVRAQVASGLASRKGSRSAATLTRALDDESDAEVQLAILSALGRVATPEAVARLIKAAEPDGRLFKKKPVSYRVAAVHALGDARTPAALSVLQSLANDKEREVREAVLRVVVQPRGESADLA